MDAPARLMVAANEPEAELVCGILRGAGFVCSHRITDMAFGSGGELVNSGAGPREVLVRATDLAGARSLIAEQLRVGDGLDDASG